MRDYSLHGGVFVGANLLGFDGLKERHRVIRSEVDYPQELSLRVHRALSWLQPAEKEDDPDVRFVLYWIAFNAAYAKAVPEHESTTEREQMQAFFQRLVELDTDGLIYKAIWTDFEGAIKLLLDNKYVFGPFWRYHNGEVSERNWKQWFSTARHIIKNALAKQDSAQILTSLFPRIYTLRNQMVHGGATWHSAVNRDQVRDCTVILSRLVPIFIKLMMEDKTSQWDTPAYPVVEG